MRVECLTKGNVPMAIMVIDSSKSEFTPCVLSITVEEVEVKQQYQVVVFQVIC